MYASNGILVDIVNDISLVGHKIGYAGRKLSNYFLNRLPPTKKITDTELLRARQLQSAKIELRLLARQKRYDDILTIAISSEIDEIAKQSVIELVSAEIDKAEQTQYLAAIANTFSRAAIPATVYLYNEGEIELALSIFLERLADGELAKLVKSEQAKPISILDLLGVLDAVAETDHSSHCFDQLFDSLAGSKTRQMTALLEILGDPSPDKPRGMHVENSVTRKVKLQAISLLKNFSVEDADRALSFAAKDKDPIIARQASACLIDLWQSQNINRTAPSNLEDFPLLNINLLIKLCQMSADFQWADSLQTDLVLEKAEELANKLVLSNCEKDESKYIRLRKEIERSEQEINRICELRVISLQPLINKITSALCIPNAALSTSNDPAIFAAYAVGCGRIEINRQILLDDQPLSVDLMSTLLHELGHMEQDVLVIKMIADDLGIKFGEHADLLSPLYEKYSAGIGRAPESMFLLAVLRLRNDKVLTPSERQRASRLYRAAYQAKISQAKLYRLKNRHNRLTQSYSDLDNGKHDSQLLSCLRTNKSIANWFSQGTVPAVLLYEIENCKKDLVLILQGLSLKSYFGDVVHCAQKVYRSGKTEAIQPIIQRLKALLLQFLREECQRLEDEMAELRRSGYHEEEAYTISDRVEVIVKSLRNGWHR